MSKYLLLTGTGASGFRVDARSREQVMTWLTTIGERKQATGPLPIAGGWCFFEEGESNYPILIEVEQVLDGLTLGHLHQEAHNIIIRTTARGLAVVRWHSEAVCRWVDEQFKLNLHATPPDEWHEYDAMIILGRPVQPQPIQRTVFAGWNLPKGDTSR